MVIFYKIHPMLVTVVLGRNPGKYYVDHMIAIHLQDVELLN